MSAATASSRLHRRRTHPRLLDPLEDSRPYILTRIRTCAFWLAHRFVRGWANSSYAWRRVGGRITHPHMRFLVGASFCPRMGQSTYAWHRVGGRITHPHMRFLVGASFCSRMGQFVLRLASCGWTDYPSAHALFGCAHRFVRGWANPPTLGIVWVDGLPIRTCAFWFGALFCSRMGQSVLQAIRLLNSC